MEFSEPITDTFPQLLPPVAYDDVPRVRLFAQLDLHTESNFFTGFSGELSDGGLFVTTYEKVAVGDAVRVDLSLPIDQFVTVQGVVIWKRAPRRRDLAPGVGIALRSLDARTLDRVERFMLRREPTFVDPEILRRASVRPPSRAQDAQATAGASRASVRPRMSDVPTGRARPSRAPAARRRPSVMPAARLRPSTASPAAAEEPAREVPVASAAVTTSASVPASASSPESKGAAKAKRSGKKKRKRGRAKRKG